MKTFLISKRLDTLRFTKNLLKSFYYGVTNKFRLAPDYVDLHDDLISPHVELPGRPIPKIIWMYWNQTKLPQLVVLAIRRITLLNPDHLIRVLNDQTIGDYIDNSFLSRDDIGLSHKSDIVRLELLYKYGGIWIDATCIFNESLSWVHDYSLSCKVDIVGYYRGKNKTDFDYPIIESWFLCASAENEFVKAWKDEFNKIRHLGSDGYFSELSSRSDYQTISQSIDRPKYLMVYLAGQIALREHYPVSFFLRRAESSAFLYQEAVDWDRERIATLLCRLKAPILPPPIIKLTNSNRYLIPTIVRYKLYKKDSIIGALV